MEINKIVAALIFGITSSSALSAVIDVDAVMKSNVSSWLSNQKNLCESKISKPTCSMFSSSTCAAKWTLYYSKINECSSKFSLTNPITNVTITSGDVRYAEVVNSPLPISIKSKTFTYKNCSSTPVMIETTEELTIESGSSVTTKDSVKTTSGASIPKLSIGGAEVGLNYSQEVSAERQETVDSKTISKSTLKISKTIMPYSVLVVQQDIRELNSWFDFSGDLHLDGLVAKTAQYKTIVPNNKVSITGQLFNVKAELTALTYKEHLFDVSTCPSNTTSTSSLQKTSSAPALNDVNVTELTSNYMDYKREPSLVNQSTIDFYENMMVTTADVIANVQVRAKNTGKNYCSAAFYTHNGDKVEFVVPPQKWSEWHTVSTHVGSVALNLTQIKNCQSSVAAQIRYYSK